MTDEELYNFLSEDAIIEETVSSRPPRLDLKRDLNAYRKQALIAAKELLYGGDVLDNIRMAGSIGEIERILSTARKNIRNGVHYK